MIAWADLTVPFFAIVAVAVVTCAVVLWRERRQEREIDRVLGFGPVRWQDKR